MVFNEQILPCCLYNYEFWLSLCKIVRSSVILLLPLSDILFTFGTHLHVWPLSLRRENWDHKTSLAQRLFITMYITSQEGEGHLWYLFSFHFILINNQKNNKRAHIRLPSKDCILLQ
jgi:hypothetical protein